MYQKGNHNAIERHLAALLYQSARSSVRLCARGRCCQTPNYLSRQFLTSCRQDARKRSTAGSSRYLPRLRKRNALDGWRRLIGTPIRRYILRNREAETTR